MCAHKNSLGTFGAGEFQEISFSDIVPYLGRGFSSTVWEAPERMTWKCLQDYPLINKHGTKKCPNSRKLASII
jgi:hypothetical protein